MLRFRIFLVALVFAGVTPSAVAQSDDRPVGINLWNLYDWSSQFLFVDAMKTSRDWIVTDAEESAWSVEGVEVPRRADGYPTHVPFEVDGQAYVPHTLMLRELETGYPGGTYTLLFEGTGAIRLEFDAAQETFTEAGVPHAVEVTPSEAGIHLVIESSDVADPVRDIRFVMPGFFETYEEDPYHPNLLALLAPYDVVRWMKPQTVENTDIVEWANRSTPATHTQSADRTGGLAYEHIVDVTNRLDKDVWLGIPPYASDDYVEQLGTFLHEHLDPEVTFYVEYANETWNTIYDYHLPMRAWGVDLGFGHTEPGAPVDSFLAGLQYNVYRSAQIFDILDDVWAEDRDRLVTVVSPLGGNPWVGEQMLNAIDDPAINPNAVPFDAVAIAPYFGAELANRWGALDILDTITVEAALDSLEVSMLVEMDVMMPAYTALAADADLDLITYEAGQHFGGIGTTVGGEAFSTLVREMQRHPRMEDVYCAYYDRWYTEGGGLLVDFALVAEPSDFESFGIVENTLQDPETSPKWRALQACVVGQTTTTSATTPTDGPTLSAAYPNPFTAHTTFELALDAPTPVRVTLYDVLGRRLRIVVDDRLPRGTHTVDVPGGELPNGTYVVRLEAGAHTATRLVTRVR